MFTRIKWFIKGFGVSSRLIELLIIVALVKENVGLKDELDEIKRPPYSKKSFSKCAKGKPVEKKKPKYPIGFCIPDTDISDDDTND